MMDSVMARIWLGLLVTRLITSKGWGRLTPLVTCPVMEGINLTIIPILTIDKADKI